MDTMISNIQMTGYAYNAIQNILQQQQVRQKSSGMIEYRHNFESMGLAGLEGCKKPILEQTTRGQYERSYITTFKHPVTLPVIIYLKIKFLLSHGQ